MKTKIPPLPSLYEAIKTYYSNNMLRSKDIIKLFKCNPSKATELKAAAMHQLEQDGVPIWNASAVDTETAYTAWGLDIKKLENKYLRLQKFAKPKDVDAS